MTRRLITRTTAGLALLLSAAAAAPADAQVRPGTPVDRNVGDTGPNAASHRVAQPGLGQFGAGSLLLDRFDDEPFETTRFDPFAGDPRVSQRYLLQSPGVTALMDRPDYIGPSPDGGWAFNAKTFDGAEILTLTPANMVYVLSPELLQSRKQAEQEDQAWRDNPYRVLPQERNDPDALMQSLRIDHRAYTAPTHNVPPQVQRDPNYVHPEIIERRKRLKAEREAEEAQAAANGQASAEAASAAGQTTGDSTSQSPDQPEKSNKSKTEDAK